MTDNQKKQYIDSGGVNCPYCGSSDIQGGSFDMESGIVTQNIKCLDCNKEWTDVYSLTGVYPFEDQFKIEDQFKKENHETA